MEFVKLLDIRVKRKHLETVARKKASQGESNWLSSGWIWSIQVYKNIDIKSLC